MRINNGFSKRFDAPRRPGGTPSARWEADYPTCRRASATARGALRALDAQELQRDAELQDELRRSRASAAR